MLRVAAIHDMMPPARRQDMSRAVVSMLSRAMRARAHATS